MICVWIFLWMIDRVCVCVVWCIWCVWVCGWGFVFVFSMFAWDVYSFRRVVDWLCEFEFLCIVVFCVVDIICGRYEIVWVGVYCVFFEFWWDVCGEKCGRVATTESRRMRIVVLFSGCYNEYVMMCECGNDGKWYWINFCFLLYWVCGDCVNWIKNDVVTNCVVSIDVDRAFKRLTRWWRRRVWWV